MTRALYGKTTNIIAVADLELDSESHKVIRSGREIKLSAKEFALLEYLMINKGKVLSREKIDCIHFSMSSHMIPGTPKYPD